MNWWERCPGRLSDEVARLREVGFKTDFDENVALTSPIVISGTFSVDEVTYKLEIRFPDLYPYFRPEVYAPDLNLAHHQNPLGKNLCLLGRNSDNWNTTDLIADVLAQQLPELLRSEKTAVEGGKPNEELQAEPWTEYLVPNRDIRILWNADITVPAGPPGKLELAYEPQQGAFTAYVTRVRRDSTDLFVESTRPIAGATANEWIHFIRLDHPPSALLGIGDMVRAAHPSFRPEEHFRKLGPSKGSLLGVFYPEESGYRQSGMGLTFVLFRPAVKGKPIQVEYVKAYRAGPNYVLSRFGPYGSIADRKVLLVGFGSLGSAVAANLCKLGVSQLTLVDWDTFEPGNTVRHWLGMPHFGQSKAEAGAEALAATYPYTAVKGLSFRFGDIGATAKTTQFLDLLDAADLVVDCSAERAVQHYLSDEAWQRGKDFVFVEGYPGMLGGYTGMIRPKTGPCFLCFLAGQEDNSIAKPPVLPNGTIQPPGCAEPTFVGTPFDSDTVAAAALRKLFGTLTSSGRYPRTDAVYYRIALANDACSDSVVRIDPVPAKRRSGCAICGTS